MRIIDIQKCSTQKWSAGTTKEIYRMPSDTFSNYDIRISLANIVDSLSTFTRLPGIQRTLILLDGEFALNHNGTKESIHPFESSRFVGDCLTRSNGIARVLNIMSPKELNYSHNDSIVAITEEETIIKGDDIILDALFLPHDKVKINGQMLKNNTLVLLEPREEIRIQSPMDLCILRISVHQAAL